MNKKILLRGVSLFSSLALLAGATFAFFSDEGTSTDNVFAAGTLDLKLSDDSPETDQDDVTASFGGATFSGDALGPGECADPSDLRVKNTGTVAGDHVEIAAVNTVTDAAPDATPDMDALLRLETFTYDAVAIVVPDSNVNGFADLEDLATNGVDDLALTDLDTDHTINLEVCLDESADNDYQGDSVDSDWTVTLNQDASQ